MTAPIDRRRFLKVTAITGTTVALASCGNPENQIVRFIPDEELVPGIAVAKPSVCPLCAAGCGVVARVMDGEVEVVRQGQPGVTRMGLVKKLEGDAAHPISRGRLCVRGQAGVQLTYHPDRLVAPQRRTGERGSGQFAEISWDEALNQLVERVEAARAVNPESVALLSRRRRGRRAAIGAGLLAGIGALPPIVFDVFDDAVLRRANELAFGHHQLPTFDLAHTRYLLNFGADLLGTWNSPLAQSAAYGAMRRGGSGARGAFIHIEPRLSQTGASADEWLPIRPGTEGALALGIAHVIMAAGLRPAAAAGRAGALIDGWSLGLPAFTPEAVEATTGIVRSRIERLAHEFATRAPAVAVIGGAPLANSNGLGQALAVNALNALAGSVGVDGGVSFMPQPAGATAPSRPLLQALGGTAPQVLLLDDTNPVFGAPPGWKTRDWLRQVPFIASFGSFVDDTSVQADLLLPDHSFLEAWTESMPESGARSLVATVTPPAMRPLYDTRATPDVLLDLSRRLRPGQSPPPPETFEAALQAAVEPAPVAASERAGGAPATTPIAWQPPEFDGEVGEFPFLFQPYASQALFDGSLAHLPWLQELPDPLTTAMWCSWVEVNARTAERLGIHDGDIVAIASAHGQIEAPVVISPGIGPETIAMPVGQGHETFTRYASGRGANPLAILAPATEPATGQAAWAATRVKLTRVRAADGQLILFGGATRERPDHAMGRG
ncbi:MAG: molybdopterin-dependent oxidoreductase [Acidobacteria bacterium]|nr:molybdopterin-dependent oxidoreductase [Acidobacteriota bacterium]